MAAHTNIVKRRDKAKIPPNATALLQKNIFRPGSGMIVVMSKLEFYVVYKFDVVLPEDIRSHWKVSFDDFHFPCLKLEVLIIIVQPDKIKTGGIRTYLNIGFGHFD